MAARADLICLALQLRAGADLPEQAEAVVQRLAEAGLMATHLRVLLCDSDSQGLEVALHPPPVTWETTARTEAARQVAASGQSKVQVCTRPSGESDVDSLIPVGNDVVELAFSCPAPVGDEHLRDLAMGVVTLARRAADANALEACQAQLGQLDDELIALHDGSLDLSGEDEALVATRIVQLVTAKLGLDRAGVFVVDQETDSLRGVMGVDERGQVVSIETTVFSLEPSSDTAVAEIAEVARGSLPYFLSRDLDGEGRRSIEGHIRDNAVVPMRFGSRIVGALAVDNYFSDRPITSEDLPRLMILANHGAATLTHVRLLEDLRRARDEMEETVEVRTAQLVTANARLSQALQSDREARRTERRAQARLLHLLSSGPAAIYSCGLEKGFPLTYASENVRALIGFEASSLIADRSVWTSRLHPDDGAAYYDNVAQLLSSGQRSVEYRIRHSDGRWRWIQDEMRVVRRRRAGHPEEIEVIGSWLDITARREAEASQSEAEEALDKQRELAMRSDRLRSLGEMAAGIAHELNQPLAGVRAMAEHMVLGSARGWDLSRDRVAERAQKIIDQADRMIHIIDHVRVFAREAGRPRMSRIDVNDAARAALDLLGVQLRSSGIEVISELTADLPAVWGNTFSLEEVVLNLLANARDATLERAQGTPDQFWGRVALRTTLTRAGHVHIEVADNGVGLAEEQLERVFEPFFTSKGPDRGTGLGLSISRSIAEQLGGRLYLESTPGEGTTAIVALPPSPTQSPS